MLADGLSRVYGSVIRIISVFHLFIIHSTFCANKRKMRNLKCKRKSKIRKYVFIKKVEMIVLNFFLYVLFYKPK